MPTQGAVQRRFAAPAMPEMEGAGAADADLQNQPAAPADDEEARAQARMVLHVAALEDKDDLKQRIAEAKTEMRAKSPSALTLFTVAAMHADFVAHIGAMVPPEGHDGGAYGSFASVDELLRDARAPACIRRYLNLLVLIKMMEQEGSDRQRGQLEPLLEVHNGFLALTTDARLATLNTLVSDAFMKGSALPLHAPAAGGAAGGNLTVTSHTPYLPKFTKEAIGDPSQRWRHFEMMLQGNDANHTHAALMAAISVDGGGATVSDWNSFLSSGKDTPGWDSKDEVTHVKTFITTQMAECNPEEFALEDEQAALNVAQQANETAQAYTTRGLKLFRKAELSRKASTKEGDIRIKVETERCKLMVSGLQPKTKEAVELALINAQEAWVVRGTPLPAGYASDHFTQWTAMSNVIHSQGKKHNPPKGKTKGSEKKPDDGDDDDGKKQKPWKWSKRNRADQVAYVALAVSRGDAFPMSNEDFPGCAFCHYEQLYNEKGAAVPMRCLDVATAAGLSLPPIVVNKDGNKLVGLCRYAWIGKPCPRQLKGDCKFSHYTPQQFKEAVEAGADMRLIEKKPAEQAAPAAPAAASSSSSLAPSSQTDSLMQQLLTLQTMQVKATTNIEKAMLDLSSKIEGLSGPADAQALASRKAQHATQARAAAIQEALQKKAEAQAATAAINSELERLQLLDDGSGPASAPAGFGAPSASGCGMVGELTADQLEEHWDTPAVQQQASVMLSSALKLATLASDTPTELLTAGQPMIVLLCARAVVRCMFDTGCSPMGLCSKATYLALRQLGGDLIGPLVKFKRPKPLGGIEGAKDVVTVDEAFRGKFTDPKSRRLVIINVGVMSGGSTGLADILVGSFHQRAWDCEWVNRLNNVIIKNPDDGLPDPITLDVDWTTCITAPLLAAGWGDSANLVTPAPIFTVKEPGAAIQDSDPSVPGVSRAEIGFDVLDDAVASSSVQDCIWNTCMAEASPSDADEAALKHERACFDSAVGRKLRNTKLHEPLPVEVAAIMGADERKEDEMEFGEPELERRNWRQVRKARKAKAKPSPSN